MLEERRAHSKFPFWIRNHTAQLWQSFLRTLTKIVKLHASWSPLPSYCFQTPITKIYFSLLQINRANWKGLKSTSVALPLLRERVKRGKTAERTVYRDSWRAIWWVELNWKSEDSSNFCNPIILMKRGTVWRSHVMEENGKTCLGCVRINILWTVIKPHVSGGVSF